MTASQVQTVPVLIVAVLVLTVVLIYWELRNRRVKRNALRRKVFANLDQAYRDGAWDWPEDAKCGYVCGPSAGDIVYILVRHSDDLAEYRTDVLAPHVRAWLYSKGLPS